MALSRHQQIRRARRSLVLTMSIVIVAFGTALILVAYPWDAIAVHGVSLRHMLTAIAPLALLSVLTILFLASALKEHFEAEDAEDGHCGGAAGFDLAEMLTRLGPALGISDKVVATAAVPPVLCEPLLAEAALAAILEDAARAPEFCAALEAGDGGVRLELACEGEPSAAAQVAAGALERAGVEVARTGKGWQLTFPVAEQSS